MEGPEKTVGLTQRSRLSFRRTSVRSYSLFLGILKIRLVATFMDDRGETPLKMEIELEVVGRVCRVLSSARKVDLQLLQLLILVLSLFLRNLYVRGKFFKV